MRTGSKSTYYPYFCKSFQFQRGGFEDRQASFPLPVPDKLGKWTLPSQGRWCISIFSVFRGVKALEKQLLLHP